MPGPRFDFTINLGHVITFGGLIATMVVGWMNFNERLTRAEETLRTSTATLVEQVRQNSELRALTDRVNRIERYMETHP